MLCISGLQVNDNNSLMDQACMMAQSLYQGSCLPSCIVERRDKTEHSRDTVSYTSQLYSRTCVLTLPVVRFVPQVSAEITMSCALRTTVSKVCRLPASASRCSARTPAVNSFTTRRPLLVRSMAAQSDTKLDKNTPDSKWKEILSAEEVNCTTAPSSLSGMRCCSNSVQSIGSFGLHYLDLVLHQLNHLKTINMHHQHAPSCGCGSWSL